ncbi:MAG: TIR domain-containing protein [Proteobacteria bacterium]|nr:TIR domain-containing protein [Pseudomonadota bacterium]
MTDDEQDNRTGGTSGPAMSGATTQAVFLSYASQDAVAARSLCESLRAAGVEVWFDQSELRGGDAWDQTIRRQIRDCALFIPIISENTASRPEGYFRLEWALAEQRTQMMSRNKTFILPVCIDSTPESQADVPDSFLRVQWTRTHAGEVPAAFSQRVRALLVSPSPAPRAEGPVSPGAPAPAARVPGRVQRKGLYGALAAILVLGAALAVFRPWQQLQGRPPAASVAVEPPVATEKSVAVLPFTDMSEKHDQEYFSDGLSEELIDVLSRIPNLRVPARTSSFSFKGKSATVGEIGHALGVTHVLEGSVRKSGDHVRITAQLVRTDNGFHLWSQSYDREVRDVFAVQDDIASAVAEQLKTALLAPVDTGKQTASTEAHNLYLKGRYVMGSDSVEGLGQAVDLFQQATHLDPNYAQAWAWLAYAHNRQIAQGGEIDMPEMHQQAMQAAQRAIALDPSYTVGYAAFATTNMQFEHDWSVAERLLDKASALDRNDPLVMQIQGHLSAAIRTPAAAIRFFHQAVDTDPLNMLPRKYLGRGLYYDRQSAEAVVVLKRAIELNPQFPGLHYELGRALLQLNQPDAAIAAFEAEPDLTWRRNGLALGYFAAHRQKEAQAALDDLVANSAGGEFQVAEAYAFFGQKDKAFEWLDNARERHDPGIIWTRHDPLFDSLGADPRFAAFLESVHMPVASAG